MSQYRTLVGLQIPRQLLVPPAVEHQLEHLLLWPQDRQRGHQLDPTNAVYLHPKHLDLRIHPMTQ